MTKTLDIKQKELDQLLERVRLNQLQEGDYELIKALAETISYLSSFSDEKAASIKRLLKMLFGSKTEKTNKKRTKKSPKKVPTLGRSDPFFRSVGCAIGQQPQ